MPGVALRAELSEDGVDRGNGGGGGEAGMQQDEVQHLVGMVRVMSSSVSSATTRCVVACLPPELKKMMSQNVVVATTTGEVEAGVAVCAAVALGNPLVA
jgi:hypothetical protein